MGNGPCSLTRACLTIATISSLYWSRSCARPKFASTSWNNTRNWKRELADKEGYFTNTWAVEIDPAGEHVVANIAKRHGFSIIGQVSTQQRFRCYTSSTSGFDKYCKCLVGCSLE